MAFIVDEFALDELLGTAEDDIIFGGPNGDPMPLEPGMTRCMAQTATTICSARMVTTSSSVVRAQTPWTAERA